MGGISEQAMIAELTKMGAFMADFSLFCTILVA